jgi:hypothetical protein
VVQDLRRTRGGVLLAWGASRADEPATHTRLAPALAARLASACRLAPDTIGPPDPSARSAGACAPSGRRARYPRRMRPSV